MEDQLSTDHQSNLTVRDVLFKYIRFLPLFVISIALAFLVAYIYLRYTTPIYKSSGALIVKEDGGGGASGGGGDRFQQMFVLDNSISIKNEVEILKSRPLMKRVVEILNLNFTYYVQGKIKESNIYKVSPFEVDAIEIADSSTSFTLHIDVLNNQSFTLNKGTQVHYFGRVFETEQGKFRLKYNPVVSLSEEYRITWQPTQNTVSEILQKLVVAPGASAGVIQMSFEATNPELARDLINTLMVEYQVATREDKNEINRRMIEFINGRMNVVEKELDSVTAVLLAFQRDNNVISPESQSGTYFNRIERGDDQINTLRAEDVTAQIIDDYLNNSRNDFSLVPSSLKLQDGTLSNMIAAYNVSQLERKKLLDSRLPETNPLVKQKEDEVERLRLNILESLKNLRQFIASEVNRWERLNTKTLVQLKSMPVKQQRLQEIETQHKSKLAVYNLLMEKREQTAISLAGTISNMKVIEEANANYIPIKPKPATVYIIALVIGLVLPGLFVFGMELLNDKVTNRFDIEKTTSVPIIGEVGHSYNVDALIVKPNQRGIIAEQFRVIRSNLQFVLPTAAKQSILITSSFSGEGKSFISTNLGAVLALANKKTIILEFDIRKPKILSHLGISKRPGITNYLLGTVKVDELPIPVPGHENLFVLACGPIPPNPAELLLEPRLKDLFAYLKEQYDVIIIDTAPVGMVSDALTLSNFATSTLYIVRQGHTYKKQIGLIDEFYREAKLPKVSIILNDVKQQLGYGYYGYGKYGYGYGYTEKSGYFTDEVPPPGFLAKWFGWLDMKKWDRKKKV